jgi:hypothetical protein
MHVLYSRLASVAFAVACVAGCSAHASEGIGANDSDLTEQGEVLSPPLSPAPTDQRSGQYSGGAAKAYAFDASGKDVLTADVSVTGAAQAWITDANFTVLASGANSGASSTRVTLTVPPGGYRTFHVVFKDTSQPPSGNFHVNLQLAQGACDPPHEGWLEYIGAPTPITPDECLQLHWGCDAPKRPFTNGCGCGCVKPFGT